MISQFLNLSEKLHSILQSSFFIYLTTYLIVINAVILGMETYSSLMNQWGIFLKLVDSFILYFFVLELSIKLLIYRKKFFHDPWSIFDFIIISVSLIPSHEVFSVLRAARILRILRLISLFPRLRRVVEGFLHALNGIASISAILGITMYVFSVMATKLYGNAYPEWFGNLHSSIFSLFQIMTLEGWPDIVRTLMKTHPHAWLFFVTFILIATFSVLNLFIAVIVEGMQEKNPEKCQVVTAPMLLMENEIQEINKKLDEIKSVLSKI